MIHAPPARFPQYVTHTPIGHSVSSSEWPIRDGIHKSIRNYAATSQALEPGTLAVLHVSLSYLPGQMANVDRPIATYLVASALMG